MLADSLFTAQGKPGSDLKLLLIGTLAPMAADAGHWWHQLATGGTHGRTYAQLFQGDLATWDSSPTIRKANPLTAISGTFRRKLLEERDEARADSRKAARFKSYRLNQPTGDERTTLLTMTDWERVLARDVGGADGAPIVAIDLGKSRAWSAASAIYASGLVRSVAVCPGIPSIADQERRDRVPRGVYQKLVDAGVLVVADGLRVPLPSQLVAAIRTRWGRPKRVVCDRFNLEQLQDCIGNVPVTTRIAKWSEPTADIASLRRMAKDGPLSVDGASQLILTASLPAATVENDTSGNSRLIKRTENVARDDVAQTLMLACGAWDRESRLPKQRIRSLGLA